MMKTGDSNQGGKNKQLLVLDQEKTKKKKKTGCLFFISHHSSLATQWKQPSCARDHAHLGLVRTRNIKLIKLLVLMVDEIWKRRWSHKWKHSFCGLDYFFSLNSTLGVLFPCTWVGLWVSGTAATSFRWTHAQTRRGNAWRWHADGCAGADQSDPLPSFPLVAAVLPPVVSIAHCRWPIWNVDNWVYCKFYTDFIMNKNPLNKEQ